VIHSDARGPLVVLTIDRPERRNALDHEALASEDLREGLAALRDRRRPVFHGR
jgi:enoyl-CoA hydratase/carnithine racemase